MADTDYDKEIEVYLRRLRRISQWQRYAIIPFLFAMLLIQVYQGYYSRGWWDGLSIFLYSISIVFNYYDSKRTFAKIVFQKLVG